MSSTLIDGAAAKIASDSAQRVELTATDATAIANTTTSITCAFAPAAV